MLKYKKNKFSLIELLVVLGILSALIMLALPQFNSIDDDAKNDVAIAEMRTIQKAFQRFAADVIFSQEKRPDLNGLSGNLESNRKLYDIALYGLWPLLCKEHPILKANDAGFVKYNLYNAEKKLGRSGPYLETEGWIDIFLPTITNEYSRGLACGQESLINSHSANGSNRKIPIIKDPFGGYYRVLCPIARTDSKGNNLSEFQRLKRMILVCTGSNKILETFPNSFNSFSNSTDDIIGAGDDTTMPLLPFTGF